MIVLKALDWKEIHHSLLTKILLNLRILNVRDSLKFLVLY